MTPERLAIVAGIFALALLVGFALPSYLRDPVARSIASVGLVVLWVVLSQYVTRALLMPMGEVAAAWIVALLSWGAYRLLVRRRRIAR